MEVAGLPLTASELVLNCLIFASNVSYGACSFGAAIIFQLGFHAASLVTSSVSGDVAEGTANIALFMTLSRIVQTINLRTHVQVKLAALLLSTVLPGLFLGFKLVFVLPTTALERSMGVLFALIVLQKLRKMVCEQPAVKTAAGGTQSDSVALDLSKPCHAAAAGTAGFMSGLLGGLFGTPGPAQMVLLIFFTVEPTQWRATSACYTTLMSLLQLWLFMGQRQVLEVTIAQAATRIAVAMAGLSVGNYLARALDQRLMTRCILSFLVLGSAMMMAAGTPANVQFLVGAVAAVLVGITVCLLHLRKQAQAGRPDTGPYAKVLGSDSAAGALEEHGDEEPRTDAEDEAREFCESFAAEVGKSATEAERGAAEIELAAKLPVPLASHVGAFV